MASKVASNGNPYERSRFTSREWRHACTLIANCLVVFNAAINFLLMLFFGNKFRRMLSDAIHCRKSSSLVAGMSTTMAAERARSKSIVALRETIF